MINWQRYKIDINLLVNNKEQLSHFAVSLNEAMIRTIYANHQNDRADWTMADHMVNRFNNFDRDPACFYSGCPSEQYKFIRSCQMDYDDMSVAIEFFRHIKYGLGTYDIETKCGPEYVQLWQTLNSIEFFYILSEDIQLKIIKNYNLIYDKM